MKQKLATPKEFAWHLTRNLLVGLFMIVVALGIGMWGYHKFEGMSWVDAFCNAAMILSGIGPVTPLVTSAGKLFAGFYALFSGLTFIAIIGVMLSPIFKRFFHKLHLDN